MHAAPMVRFVPRWTIVCEGKIRPRDRPWRTRREVRKEDYMDVSGRVVVITGASAGIGMATARLLARHGARLALAARSADTLERLVGELAGAIAIPTDMRDEQAVRRLIARAHEHFGRIDVLVNNAGQGMHVPVEHADLGQYRAVLELNVVGVLGAMQAVIPIMRAQGGGVIVNMSSGTTKMLGVGLAPYASTKHALNAISLAARAELAPDGIQVCLVIPSMVSTAFHMHLANGPATWSRERGRTPTVAMDTPEHVAEKVLEAIETEAAEVYTDTLKARR